MTVQLTPMRIAIYCQTLWKAPDLITVQRVTLMETLNRCCDIPPTLSVYIDDGYCPNTQVRPDFQRLLRDIAAGQLDCVAVFGCERLAQRASDYAVLKRYLDKYGVVVMECQQMPARMVRIAA